MRMSAACSITALMRSLWRVSLATRIWTTRNRAMRSTSVWTSQFFSRGFERGPLTDYIVSGYSDYMKSSAPTVSLEPPDLKAIADRMENGTRILRFNIRSTRRAPVVMITADSGSEVLSSTIGEERIANQKGRRWGPALLWCSRQGPRDHIGVEII